ncbi:MAG: ABC transporter ATP-binding protein [Pseudomonadota bacterium]
MTAAALIAETVTKRFGSLAVVHDASLRLEPATLTALLGASGAGKSTLLRVLAGLEPLDAGQVRIGETVLSRPGMTVPAERRRTGLIFQDYALFPHLTALQNVAFGLTGKTRTEAAAIAATWLDRLSLTHRAKAFPHQLSGGEQQRVAIARALAPDPDAILMDEPFSGLDPALESEVREAALKALHEAGKPALLVTHDPAAAMAVADQLAIMRAGRIVQSGLPEDVYSHPVDVQVAQALGAFTVIALDELPEALLPQAAQTAVPGSRLGLRDEAVVFSPESSVTARVETVSFIGAFWRVAVTVAGKRGALHLTTRLSATDPKPDRGDSIPICLRPHGRFIFPPAMTED